MLMSECFSFVSIEPPRFINQSDSIQIAELHSTVNLLCGIYSVPSPTITWYKITQKNRQTIGKDDLQLLSVNSQQYERSNWIHDVYLWLF